MFNSPKYKIWLPNRPDQTVIALIILVAFFGVATWYWKHGGFSGKLVEIEQAQPLTARFLVNINTADEAELRQLPAIGPNLAKRIVELRKSAGPFKNIDDLLQVKGIGPKILERMRPYLLPVNQEKDGRKEIK